LVRDRRPRWHAAVDRGTAYAELVKILDMPEIRRSFAEQGAAVQGGTPTWFGVFMREESARWAAVIKEAGIKPE
jgi:hypothetical protein